MKAHRQIKKSNTVGDPSSKYAYGRSLDDDIKNKNDIQSSITDYLEKMIDELMSTADVYDDGTAISLEQKWKCLVTASLNIKSKYGL